MATGWTEPRALRNKARRWVIDAIDDIRTHMPFPLLGLDSDTTLRPRRDESIHAGVFGRLETEALAAFDRIVGLDLEQRRA